MIKQLEIKPSYSCNNNCIFCLYKDIKGNVDYANLITNLKLFKKKYNPDIIEYSGGEPTIYYEFHKLLKCIISYKYKFLVIHTNARKFKNNSFLDDLPKSNYYFFVSIHSKSPNIHNKIVKNEQAFNETVKGIKNLDNYINTIKIVSNTILTKYNYENIPDLVKFLCQFKKIKKIELRLPIILPNTDSSYIIKDLTNIKSVLDEVYDILSTHNKRLQIFNIPFCLLSDKITKAINNSNKRKKEYFFLGKDNINKINKLKSKDSALSTIIKDYNTLYYKTKDCYECNFEEGCLGIPILYNSNFTSKNGAFKTK